MLSYLRNGSEFWRNRGIHHPFLLDQYRGNGRFYHETFRKIGFTPKHAECVSFVELLPFPTYGKSNLKAKDLASDEIQEHLRILNEIIACGDQFIFIPKTVGRLLKIASKHFCWMPDQPTRDIDGQLDSLERWHNDVKDCVYWHYHFSCWGRCNNVKQRQIVEIRKICINSPK